MMGLFGNTSSFDPVVEKCTAETNTKEDWGLMLDICDKVSTSAEAPRDCFRAIMRRLRHQDPHVVLLAITLLDTCVSNCGLPFHLEIASREFEQEFKKLLQKHQEKTIRDKLLSCLQKWAENEFKSDPSLDLIPSLYNHLKSKGYDFPSDSPSKSKKSITHHHHHHKTKDHSAAAAQQEEADLAKAIELSLKEAQGTSHGSPQHKSLYPQVSGGGGSAASGSSATKSDKEPRKVRALYDFEAAEDNELTFYSGEIVFVSDDSDPNWWEGENQRGRGLFPANFVTPDLDAEPSQLEQKKSVQFSEEVEVKSIETEPEVVEIDEAKIDTVLHMLHEADPTGEVPDPPELAPLEEQVQQMGPLIDQELEKIDRRHAQLTRLGGELVEALNMYHNLMRDPGISSPSVSLPYNLKMGMGMPYGSMPPMPHANFAIPTSVVPGMPQMPYGANVPHSSQTQLNNTGVPGMPTSAAGIPTSYGASSMPPQPQSRPMYGNSTEPVNANVPGIPASAPGIPPTVYGAPVNTTVPGIPASASGIPQTNPPTFNGTSVAPPPTAAAAWPYGTTAPMPNHYMIANHQGQWGNP